MSADSDKTVPVDIVQDEKEARRIRITQREVMKKIRKKMPPAERIHMPKNVYRRERWDWRQEANRRDED